MTFAVHPISSHQQVWKPGQALQNAVTISAKIPTVGSAVAVVRFKASVDCDLRCFYLRPDQQTRYDGPASAPVRAAAGTETGLVVETWQAAFLEVTASPLGNGTVTYADATLAPQSLLPNQPSGFLDSSQVRRLRLIGGGAFERTLFQAAVAGQPTHLHILNPAGSGRVVRNFQFALSYSVAGLLDVRRFDSPEASWTYLNGVSPDQGSDVASVGLVASAAGPLPAGAGALLETGHTLAPPSFALVTGGSVLEPGMGLLISSQQLNVELRARFNWAEVPLPYDESRDWIRASVVRGMY